MNPALVLGLLWLCISGIVTCLYALLRMAMKNADEWDHLAHRAPVLYLERRDVTVIDRPFDWARYEHEVGA